MIRVNGKSPFNIVAGGANARGVYVGNKPAWGSDWFGYGEARVDDVVMLSDRAYRCIKSHTRSSSTMPGSTGGAAYWA